MDTRDFSVDTIQEIYDIIEELKGQGTIGDSKFYEFPKPAKRKEFSGSFSRLIGNFSNRQKWCIMTTK